MQQQSGMLDRSTKGHTTNRYRRCRSSDDLLQFGVYGNKKEADDRLRFDQEIGSPRILKRAERYRLAGRRSDAGRTGMVIEAGENLLFTSVNGRRYISCSTPSLRDCPADDFPSASAMVFVYSGQEGEARKSVIQWNEMPFKDTTKLKADAPRTLKKSPSSRMKDKVAAFLQNNPVLRRRKKGVDHSVNMDARMVATIHHTKSLPDVLDVDTRRPRSKSSDNLIMPDSDSTWSLGSESIARKMSRTGTDVSNVSSTSESSMSKSKVTRSRSLARSRNALEDLNQLGEKSFSYSNILSYSKKKGRTKKRPAIERDESEDDLSSPGSEASPYLSQHRRTASIDGIARDCESAIVIQQAPVTRSLHQSNEYLNKQVVYKKLSTSIKFQNIRIREIADEELRNHLEGQSFIPEQISRLSKNISEAIKRKVEESTGGQFKVIVQVYIGNLADQGIMAASQCLYQKEVDSFVVVAFRNKKLFGYASVLALDFRCEAENGINGNMR